MLLRQTGSLIYFNMEMEMSVSLDNLIIRDIEESELSFRQISEKYNVSFDYVDMLAQEYRYMLDDLVL